MNKSVWHNTVGHTEDRRAFRGGVVRTSGGSMVHVRKCSHRHPTWAEARECAGRMEQEANR